MRGFVVRVPGAHLRVARCATLCRTVQCAIPCENGSGLVPAARGFSCSKHGIYSAGRWDPTSGWVLGSVAVGLVPRWCHRWGSNSRLSLCYQYRWCGDHACVLARFPNNDCHPRQRGFGGSCQLAPHDGPARRFVWSWRRSCECCSQEDAAGFQSEVLDTEA